MLKAVNDILGHWLLLGFFGCFARIGRWLLSFIEISKNIHGDALVLMKNCTNHEFRVLAGMDEFDHLRRLIVKVSFVV